MTHNAMALESDSAPHQTQLVIVDYEELLQFSRVDLDGCSTPCENNNLDVQTKKVLDKIGQAFGNEEDCLGIIAISGVPDFSELRQRVLPMAQELANLPSQYLDQVVVPSASYSVGWSHGQEKLAGKNNPPDVAKGSFYANPFTDDLLKEMKERRLIKDENHAVEDCDDTALDLLARENPAFFAPNVWPTDSLPRLESSLKELGQLIGKVGCLLARPCDVFVQQLCPTYPAGKLERILSTSQYAKARLLHYFAMPDAPAIDTMSADWCAWHKDHGSLTGLVPAMYLDQDGNQVASPDSLAGLYIQTRAGPILQVQLPPNVLAFQLGETSQIHTGGILRATPHAVRGPRLGRSPREADQGDDNLPEKRLIVTRETLAVFLEPEYHGDMALPPGRVAEDIYDDLTHLPPSISPIQSRWKQGQNFGEFSNATFAAFYE